MKVREVIAAVDGWNVVLPAVGPERVRFVRVACWAVVEDPSGGRKVEPMIGGPTRTLEMAPSSALGIASPGETLADWRERLRAQKKAQRDLDVASAPSDEPAKAAPKPADSKPTRRSGEHEVARRSGEGEVRASKRVEPPKPADDDIIGAAAFDLDDDD